MPERRPTDEEEPRGAFERVGRRIRRGTEYATDPDEVFDEEWVTERETGGALPLVRTRAVLLDGEVDRSVPRPAAGDVAAEVDDVPDDGERRLVDVVGDDDGYDDLIGFAADPDGLLVRGLDGRVQPIEPPEEVLVAPADDRATDTRDAEPGYDHTGAVR